MKDNLAPWVASFSHSQQCFDVDTLKAYLQRSTERVLTKNPFDYTVIGIFDTHREASNLCNEVREAAGIKNVFERFMEEHPE